MYNQKEIKVSRTEAKKKNPWSKDKIVDPRGQWAHPGENTRIPSNQITMAGVPYPVMGVPNIGAPTMMMPGEDYNFPGANYVDEYPMMQEGGPIEVYEGSDQWDAYQAQKASVDKYNKWKTEHDRLVAAGLKPAGTVSVNPVTGEKENLMKYGTPENFDFGNNNWTWTGVGGPNSKGTAYNYAPYVEEPKNLVDYKVVESPDEFDARLRKEYLENQGIIGYRKNFSHNTNVSGDNYSDLTPIRKGEEIPQDGSFVDPSQVPNVVPSFGYGGSNKMYKFGGDLNRFIPGAQEGMEVPKEFKRGDFNVTAHGPNSYFEGQPGWTDYSQHVVNKPHYQEAMEAHAFPIYQPNTFEEGTRDWKKQERQNIQTVKKGYRQAKRDWRKGRHVDVFQDGGEFQEMELTNAEIAELRRQGYRVDEL